MGNCHYCFDCGRCRGETPPAVYARRCFECRHVNPLGSEVCERCGASLFVDPTQVRCRTLRQAQGGDRHDSVQ